MNKSYQSIALELYTKLPYELSSDIWKKIMKEVKKKELFMRINDYKRLSKIPRFLFTLFVKKIDCEKNMKWRRANKEKKISFEIWYKNTLPNEYINIFSHINTRSYNNYKVFKLFKEWCEYIKDIKIFKSIKNPYDMFNYSQRRQSIYYLNQLR